MHAVLTAFGAVLMTGGFGLFITGLQATTGEQKTNLYWFAIVCIIVGIGLFIAAVVRIERAEKKREQREIDREKREIERFNQWREMYGVHPVDVDKKDN